MNIIRILSKIYNLIFPNRLKIKKLIDENAKLKKQNTYLKQHCDITKMKVADGCLRKYQLDNLEYVYTYTNFLKNELNISCFLESGSCLGAIRHNGYIPWDDDMDIGLLHSDYNKLIEYAKKNYIWYDTYEIKENAFFHYDEIIKNHKNEYVAILSPFCLHIYKGESIKDALNAEFFPWDYVKETVTENEYLEYITNIRLEISKLNSWTEIFDFYKKIEKNNIFSDSPTSKIAPGIGHWDFARHNTRGLLDTNSIFPCKLAKFENYKMFIPNNPEKYLLNTYGDYMSFPEDVGVSHHWEEMDNVIY